MSKQKYQFINLQSPTDDWAEKIYNVTVCPRSFLLDTKGNVVFDHLGGSADDDSFVPEIEALLNQAAKKANR